MENDKVLEQTKRRLFFAKLDVFTGLLAIISIVLIVSVTLITGNFKYPGLGNVVIFFFFFAFLISWVVFGRKDCKEAKQKLASLNKGE